MKTVTHSAVTALSAVLEDAANLLRVPVDSVAVEGVEARQWPDSCLGIAAGDEACVDVVTPGYRIRLGDGMIYHADQQGHVRRARENEPRPDTEIRLRYTVSGGIGGGFTSYETDTHHLSDAEEQELRRLIGEADFFNVPNVLPDSPVADGITVRLWIAVGRRNHEVVRGDGIEVEDTEAFGALAAWAAARTPSLFPRMPTDLG